MKTNKHISVRSMAAFLILGAFCTGTMAQEKSLEDVEKAAGSGDPAYKNQILDKKIVGRVTSRSDLNSFSTASFDLVAGYHWLSPRKSADWNNAAGIEIQGRFWQNEHLGFALVGASDTWKARPEITEEDSGDTYIYTSVNGNATVTSLGASLLYRSESSAEVKLVMDVGLRYAMVDSAVYGEAAYDGPGGPNYLYEKIGIDNTLLFVIGAGLEFEVNKNVSFTLGLGYQVDLKKPEETFAGESLGETGLDAVSYGISLTCKF